MKNPCRHCPIKKPNYHCALECKKRDEYWRSLHEPWMAVGKTHDPQPETDNKDLNTEEMEAMMRQLRAMPSAYSGKRI